jgi:uncharacterized protein (DUF362 family)
MTLNYDRREFLKISAIATSAAIIMPQLAHGKVLANNIDIAVLKGTDIFNNTITAIEQIGGISKFVPKGSKVGLLVNTPPSFTKQGSHVNTDIILAVLKLLNDAGVNEIRYLNSMAGDVYKRSDKSVQFEGIIKNIKDHSNEYKDVEIPGAIILKNAKVIKDLFECDIFINIPVTKHHDGTLMTNCLKNFMGACKRETNQFFHKSNEGQESSEHLSQCIADVNLVRKPDLCISDASEILTTNGPFGPGEILRPMKVYAGTNPVAMDAYGATILGHEPKDIPSVVMANQHKIGTMDLQSLIIKES